MHVKEFDDFRLDGLIIAESFNYLFSIVGGADIAVDVCDPMVASGPCAPTASSIGLMESS
jgi:hypothetical protein